MTFCLKCGEVQHVRESFDEFHCDCYRDLSLRPCFCNCHVITSGQLVPSPVGEAGGVAV